MLLMMAVLQPKSYKIGILLVNVCIAFLIFHYKFGMDLDARNKHWDNISTTTYQNADLIHIFLCTDKKDRFPMYILINSIILNENQINRLYFHLLIYKEKSLFEKEFQKYFKQYLPDINYEIKSIIDDKYSECINYNNIASKYYQNYRLNNPMNLARFCLPDIFPDVSVGIYLDADMIVQDSISKIYDNYYNNKKYNFTTWSVINTNITDMDAGAQFNKIKRTKYMNRYINKVMHKKFPSVLDTPIDFKHLDLMFNGGILMFNLDIWREFNLTKQSLELFKFSNKYQKRFGAKPWNMVTQPICNMLFLINNIQIGDLGERWNYLIKHHIDCTESFITIEQQNEIENQSVIHWAGKRCKPWGKFKTLSSLWLKYLPLNANITNWGKHKVSFA